MLHARLLAAIEVKLDGVVIESPPSQVGRPDLAYGCWANAAGAATAAGEHERALEFLDLGMAALCGYGLQGLEIHLLAARAFVLRRLDRLEAARGAAAAEQALAEPMRIRPHRCLSM